MESNKYGGFSEGTILKDTIRSTSDKVKRIPGEYERLQNTSEKLQAKADMLEKELDNFRESEALLEKTKDTHTAKQYYNAHIQSADFVKFAKNNPTKILEIEQMWLDLRRTGNPQLKLIINLIDKQTDLPSQRTPEDQLYQQENTPLEEKGPAQRAMEMLGPEWNHSQYEKRIKQVKDSYSILDQSQEVTKDSNDDHISNLPADIVQDLITVRTHSIAAIKSTHYDATKQVHSQINLNIEEILLQCTNATSRIKTYIEKRRKKDNIGSSGIKSLSEAWNNLQAIKGDRADNKILNSTIDAIKDHIDNYKQ